jgi:hypothetical protein
MTRSYPRSPRWAENQEKPTDNHGRKAIAIPLDGAALDRDLQNAPEAAAVSPSPAPAK